MLKIVGAGFALLAVVGAAAPAMAGGVTQLVTNGDFETVSGGNGTQISPTPGTQNVSGWTLGTRSNDSTASGLGFVYTSGQGDSTTNTASGVYLWGPANGNNNGLAANSGFNTTGGTTGGNYLALDADPAVSGTLSQTINGLTAGYGYVLTFAWATAELRDANFGDTTDQFQVSLGSQTQTTQTLSTTVKGFDSWRQVTLYFTATSASELLSFLAVGSPSGMPPTALLDAVSLTYAPEPSTWAVMLSGVFGLAGFTMVKRRSRGGQLVVDGGLFLG